MPQQTSQLRPAPRTVDFLLEVARERPSAGHDAFARMLELATRFFEQDFGIVSRVVGNAYVIESVFDSAGAGLAPGQRFPLGDTYCAMALEADDVVSIDEMRSSSFSGHPCYAAFKLESYLGVPLYVDGKLYGTLNFSSAEPRLWPWTETDRQLVRLIAKWIEQAHTLSLTNARLARSNRDLDQFAYVASHDLQEPLRMVLGYSSLIASRHSEQLGPEASEFLDFIVDGARRMQVLIQDLLQYARVGSGKRTFEVVDTAELVGECLVDLSVLVEETGAEVSCASLPAVRADPTLARQLFFNLIGNGIKFHGTRPPRIEIRAERAEDAWRFFVRDNGIGIPADQQERILEPFQRLHSRDEYPGTGIGLALCARVAEEHGGRLTVESQPGSGSTFSFTLPAVD